MRNFHFHSKKKGFNQTYIQICGRTIAMPSKDQDPAGYGPITVLTFAILSKRSLQIRGMMPV